MFFVWYCRPQVFADDFGDGSWLDPLHLDDKGPTQRRGVGKLVSGLRSAIAATVFRGGCSLLVSVNPSPEAHIDPANSYPSSRVVPLLGDVGSLSGTIVLAFGFVLEGVI